MQGQKIGDFQVVREIATGLMGKIFHVSADNAYWALRLLDDRVVRQTATVNRLVGDERHTALVRYKETGADPAQGTFLVTDYIEARSISRDAIAGLPSRLRVDALVQLFDGIKWLHENDLVHGCIKPSNVMFSMRKDKIELAMFTDAGLVYVPSAANEDRLLRRAYPYCSPELVEAYSSGDRATIDGSLTKSSDIYGLGMMIAESFSGRRLFADCRSIDELLGEKQSTAIRMVCLNQPRKHIDLRKLSQLVEACTAPSMADRPKSVAEVLEQLQGAVVQEKPWPNVIFS